MYYKLVAQSIFWLFFQKRFLNVLCYILQYWHLIIPFKKGLQLRHRVQVELLHLLITQIRTQFQVFAGASDSQWKYLTSPMNHHEFHCSHRFPEIKHAVISILVYTQQDELFLDLICHLSLRNSKKDLLTNPLKKLGFYSM